MLVFLAAMLSLYLAQIISSPGQEFYDTALIYETGNDSISADPSKSTLYYKLAANEGHTAAQNYLGFRYYNGEGVQQNVDSAIYWIKKAAEAGDIKAAGNMGYLLSKAPDIRHDYKEAYRWLSLAVDSGLPTAFTQLGDLYREGLGCLPDTTKAMMLYDKAINARIGDAQNRLLAMMGFKWKELSPDSALSLALKYYPAPAPMVGADLLENAANGRNPRAMALLGDAYSKGLGVAYNHDKSIYYFALAAILGDPSAQYILSELLDFFPDSLDGIEIEIPDASFSSEMKTADFWRGKAAEAKIYDGDEAYKRLFAP